MFLLAAGGVVVVRARDEVVGLQRAQVRAALTGILEPGGVDFDF